MYLKENKINTINGISIPAKILSSILDLGKPIYKKFLNKIKYIPAITPANPLKAKPEIAFIFFCWNMLFLLGNKFIFFAAVTNL